MKLFKPAGKTRIYWQSVYILSKIYDPNIKKYIKIQSTSKY